MSVNPRALTSSRASAAKAISEATREHFSNDNSAVKRLAEIVERELRTSENYWQGKTCPGAPEFLRIAAEVPELRGAALMAMFKLNPNDPRAAELLAQLERYAASLPPGSMD